MKPTPLFLLLDFCSLVATKVIAEPGRYLVEASHVLFTGIYAKRRLALRGESCLQPRGLLAGLSSRASVHAIEALRVWRGVLRVASAASAAGVDIARNRRSHGDVVRSSG